MKKERLQYKDASDVYIKKNSPGYKELGKGSESVSRKKASTKKTLKLNTKETFSKYPNAFAEAAAAPAVKTKHQDAKINVASNKQSLKDTARSRGLDQKNYKKRS